MLVDVCTDGHAALCHAVLGAYLAKSPVVGLRGSDRAFDFTILIEFGFALFIEFCCDNEYALLAYPVLQADLALSAINHAIGQVDIVPSALAGFLFIGVEIDIGHHLFDVFDNLAFVYVLAVVILATQLIVAALLIEVKEYPCQFLFGDGFEQCLLTQVIERPVVRNLLVIGHQFGLLYLEIGQHLVEGTLEQE